MKKFLIAFFDCDPNSVIIPIGDNSDGDLSLLRQVKMLGLSPSNVVKSFTLTMNDYVVPEKYLSCFKLKEDKLVFDNSQIMYENLDFWMAQRQELFNDLDVEFIRALEDGDENKVSKIKAQKKFLRDLPNFIPLKLAEVMGIEDAYTYRDEDGKPVGVVDSYDALSTSQQIYYKGLFNERYSVSQVLKYTPFYNILYVDVVNGGSGYKTTPTIEFNCDYEMAFPPLCKVILEDEKVKKVEVLIAGCGIVGDYSMIVSKPDEGDNHAEIKTEVCNQVDINYPSFEVPPQER